MLKHSPMANGSSWDTRLARFLGTSLAALAVTVAGCGAPSLGDGEESSGGNRNIAGVYDANNAGADKPAPPAYECMPIKNGTSSVKINGNVRNFDVRLPNDTSRMALLFQWHGWMQMPGQFANEIVYDPPAGKWLPFDPNAFPMPLMIVTPWDQKLIPPFGLDWDIVTGAADFPYFEAMVQCINSQFQIDQKRIYSFGFSAGAVFTNLLDAKYPHLFAATISESGAWFNDQTQWSDVSIPIMQWKWPALNPADGGNTLITHGGENDFATVISLENTSRKALPFLRAGGRTVVDCSHTFGHTLAPDLTQGMIYQFMWERQQGAPPAGFPSSFPTPERPIFSTACTFHPAN